MNTTNLIQHHMEKFGVVTVMDVVLSTPVTKEPKLILDTLKITSLDQEGQQKEIRGGIGAPELISYDFARTISVEIQDALASMASLKVLWGGKYVDGDIDYLEVIKGAVLAADGKYTLAGDVTLKDGDAFNTAIAMGAKDVHKVTAAGKVLTVTGGEEGDVVDFYLPAEKASGEAIALAINSIDLPPTLHFIGKTFFIDQATGKKVLAEIEIPLFKVNISGGMAMEAEGDAAVFDFSGKALQDPVTKNFFVLKQLGNE